MCGEIEPYERARLAGWLRVLWSVTAGGPLVGRPGHRLWQAGMGVVVAAGAMPGPSPVFRASIGCPFIGAV